MSNGNRKEANNFLLDGVDNNQVSDNLTDYLPNVDAIQEFKLITNNASAEFGNFEGDIINMVIKSGANNFHGNVFEFSVMISSTPITGAPTPDRMCGVRCAGISLVARSEAGSSKTGFSSSRINQALRRANPGARAQSPECHDPAYCFPPSGT
jgi:hypothetical protein